MAMSNLQAIQRELTKEVAREAGCSLGCTLAGHHTVRDMSLVSWWEKEKEAHVVDTAREGLMGSKKGLD